MFLTNSWLRKTTQNSLLKVVRYVQINKLNLEDLELNEVIQILSDGDCGILNEMIPKEKDDDDE